MTRKQNMRLKHPYYRGVFLFRSILRPALFGSATIPMELVHEQGFSSTGKPCPETTPKPMESVMSEAKRIATNSNPHKTMKPKRYQTMRYHLTTFTDDSLKAILEGGSSEATKDEVRKILQRRTVPVTKPLRNP